MNVKATAVTNAANLSFFMVHFSFLLLRRFRQLNPEFSILDLKSPYRGCRYVSETIKLLPHTVPVSFGKSLMAFYIVPMFLRDEPRSLSKLPVWA